MKNSIIILLISSVFLLTNCEKDDTMKVSSNNNGSPNPRPGSYVSTDLSGLYSNDGFIDGIPFGSDMNDGNSESNSTGSLRVYKDYPNSDEYVFVHTESNLTITFKVAANGLYFNLVPGSFFMNGISVQVSGLKVYKIGSDSYDGWYDQGTKTIYFGVQTTQPQALSPMPVNNSDKL